MDWLKIASALMIVALMFLLYPSLKRATSNSPKAVKGDWISVVKPLLFVVIFIIALIIMVR